jgi:hypothetical protein
MLDDGSQIGAEAFRRLAALDTVAIAPGLTDDEVARVENAFGFEFADDHRAFLSAGLPIGGAWPNWRESSRKALRKWLRSPADNVLFDVEMNDFWGAEWGVRPARMKDALRSANYHLARVPQLVPVHSHRYLPAGRGSHRHPVLSVYQTDVICYGTDLFDYINREFGKVEPDTTQPATSSVRFWSDLID